MKKNLFIALTVALTGLQAMAQKTITVKADKPIADMSPIMYGVFFEDINFGADGGIYAELIKNRSFEFFKPLMGWKAEQQPFIEGTFTIENRGVQHTANPRFLRVKTNAQQSLVSLTNEGFRGMGIKQGLRYDCSFLYRGKDKLTYEISLLNAEGKTIGSTTFTPEPSADWKKATASLRSTATEAKGKFKIVIKGAGQVDLDMISLFPEDTWKGRPGGMRADMIQMLADMKPGFIRFPGGCIVEGYDLTNRYQWKRTIGPIEDRQLIMNRWNIEFPNRAAPDYFQTFGLGFFEYFQLSEDVGAEPLPILNCGMACQFNSAELVPMEQIDPYVQDALDLIEFANGPISSTWGAKRAQMGHPTPFNLKFIGVGNENWGPQYLERLAAFQQAIKSTYPNINIVASSGTDPNGERFDYLNAALRKMNIELIDEHYYRKPEWFQENAKRYDNYPRTGSKVFAGEYAAHPDKTTGPNKNNWFGALSEAAFLTGLERNADVVRMASYAPLFAHVDGWQWAPDLIWVDNLSVAGTTDYQIQKLFSLNKGHKVVPALIGTEAIAGQDSLYATAAIDTAKKELIVKIVNTASSAPSIKLQIDGVKTSAVKGTATVMQHQELTAMNSIDAPNKVLPSQHAFDKQSVYTVLPYSVNILRIPLK